MPELPEVEVTRRGLLPHLPGCLVEKITWSDKNLRLPIPGKHLTAWIQGKKVRSIDRRAKFLLFRMAGGGTMVVHLGMTGKLALMPAGSPEAKHDHLCLLLDNGMELRLNDSRRFGSITVWSPDESGELEERFCARLGVEPLSDNFHADYLRQICKNKKQPVKTFLMDAKKVAGIGNIYANEILFASGVHPLTPVKNLSRLQWRKITASTGTILQQAIKCGGSTIADFLGTSGNPGYFQLRFRVYDREGKNCCRCTSRIRKIVVGGRATYFCPTCQARKR